MTWRHYKQSSRGYAHIVEMSEREIWIGEVCIRRKFTVTAVKFFTQYIASPKIVPPPILNNCFSSNLNVLYVTIGCIKYNVGKKLFKWYKICEFLIFFEVVETSLLNKLCRSVLRVVCIKLNKRIFVTSAHK